MEVYLNKNAQLFLDLQALAMVNKRKEIFVYNKNAFVSTPNFLFSFTIDADIPAGKYKIKNHTKTYSELITIPSAEVRIPDIDITFTDSESIRCVPGMKLNAPIVTKKAILSRMLGKTLGVLYQDGGTLITCENMNLILFPKIETTSKMLVGVPADIIEKMNRFSMANGTSVNAEIINILRNPPAPSAPPAHSEPTVMKMLQGIPKSHMETMTSQAASAGTSVNKLILGLIADQATCPKTTYTPSPSVPVSKRNKLLAGIPVDLMERLKQEATSAGMSVNKYIIGRLSNE